MCLVSALLVTTTAASFLVYKTEIVSQSSVLKTVTSFLIPIMLNQDATKTLSRIRNAFLSRYSLGFLLLFWIFYSMLISMFYASMIKASLTIPSVYKPITSLREVVNSGLEYTLFIDPVEKEVWKESPDPLIRLK